MKNIALIGFSRSGKTTVGKLLAQKLDVDFFDTDSEIEKMQNLSVFDIFQKYGEEHFRKLENELLLNLPKNSVVSLGGGTVLCKNFELLKGQSIVVFLKTSFEAILQRHQGDKPRPLFVGKTSQQLFAFFLERQKFYEKFADFVVETDNLTADEVADKIIFSTNS